MQLNRAVFFVLAAAALLPAQPAGNEHDSRGFLYVAPAGWNTVEKDEATLLVDPTAGMATLIALAASPLDGDLRHTFDQTWAGVKQSYRITQEGQPSSLLFKGSPAIQSTAMGSDQNRRRWLIGMLCVRYANHVQTIMFLSTAPPGPALSAREKMFQAFLSALRFSPNQPLEAAQPGQPPRATQSQNPADDLFGPAAANSAAPPKATADSQAVDGSAAASAPAVERTAAPPAGMLDGIYMGYNITNGKAGLRRLFFNPDGWVVKDVPQEGMIGFDFTAYRNSPKVNRSWVGRYRVDGDSINIVWQDYADHREIIQKNDASAKPGPTVYVPMCHCTGKRFSGKYIWGFASSGQFIQFFPDGTFIDHGVLDQMFVPNPYFDHPRTQRGTYAIESQTIVFNFADGHRGTRTFWAPKAQENQSLFNFVGLGIQILYEEHYQTEP